MSIVNWLNVASSTFGFLGTLLIFFYGIPNKIDTGGHSYLAVSQINPNDIKQIRKYKIISHVGLGMLAVSFLLQFVNSIAISH